MASWLLGSLAILALALLGPPLWARQSTGTSQDAVSTAAVGLAIFFIVGWPMWTFGNGVSRWGIASTVPVWMLLAAGGAGSPLTAALHVAGRLTLLVVVLCGIAIVARRYSRWKFVLWAALLMLALGPAVLEIVGNASLFRKPASGSGFHLSPLFLLHPTPSHGP